jgi:hypothetical protein
MRYAYCKKKYKGQFCESVGVEESIKDADHGYMISSDTLSVAVIEYNLV